MFFSCWNKHHTVGGMFFNTTTTDWLVSTQRCCKGGAWCHSIFCLMNNVSIPAFQLLMTVCFNNMKSESEKSSTNTRPNRTRNKNLSCVRCFESSKLHPHQPSRNNFMSYSFIWTQALLLLIHTLKPCRHHRLMHAGNISKHDRSTENKKVRERCVFTLLATESPGGDAALEHLAVHGPGNGRGLLEKSLGQKVKWYVATDCTHCTQ